MRMKKLLVVLFCLLPLSAQAAELGEHFTLEHDKIAREYFLFTPKGDSKKARPLVVVLHGGAGSPQNIAETTGFSELAAKKGFMVAYPLGLGHVPTWNAGRCCGYAERRNVDDVGFIEKMIADIKSRRNVDTGRVYATGLSNGAMMAYRLACELSSTFAAIAPVAGAMNVFSCEPNGRPSVIIFHALDDKHVLYKGGVPQKGIRAAASHKPEPDASVADAMQFWLKTDYCRKFPGVEDLGEVARVTYFCAEDRHVMLNTLDTGGHSWPGGKKGWAGADEPNKNVKATEEIWQFFTQHPPTELF
jgi:polyhydroxybutyrate depolymerase